MSNSCKIGEIRHHVRSISMPCRSNPNIPKSEEELRKLRIWRESSSFTSKAKNVCVGLEGLLELYKCVEDLLQLPMTQQGLIYHKNEKWVDDILDGSIRLLDICGTTKDILSQMKENVRDFRSALRRRGGGGGGESCKEKKVDNYISCRKKMNKCINKYVGDLKIFYRKLVSSPLDVLDQNHLNNHLEMVIRVLREVRAVTVSIFQYSLLSFMSETKTTKWSFVSKFIQKGKVRCVDENDVVECVDVALRSLFRRVLSEDNEVKNVEIVQYRLEELEASIEGVEAGLECVSRRLIQTRVSLLNIFTN